MEIFFLTFIGAEIERADRKGHYGQARKMSSARNSMRHFLATMGRQDIRLTQLTGHVVQGYQEWLQDRGISRNSSACYMRTLQSLYNKAAAETGSRACHPFANVYRGVAKTRKRAASVDTIRRIQTADIAAGLVASGCNPARKTFAALCRRIAFARDLFIFSYCACGMSFVDMAYLRKSDVRDGIICYVRRKTGQRLEVAVEPPMRDIISRHAQAARHSPYVFPLLHATAQADAYRQYRSALRAFNHYLKMLSAIIGGGLSLTSYVARHSWASNMYQQDIPLSVISQGLGHDSEITTQIYVKSLENSVVQKVNHRFIAAVFSSPFLGEEREEFGCKDTHKKRNSTLKQVFNI